MSLYYQGYERLCFRRFHYVVILSRICPYMDIYTCICINTHGKRSTLSLKPDILRCREIVSFVLPDGVNVIIYNIYFGFSPYLKLILGLSQKDMFYS